VTLYERKLYIWIVSFVIEQFRTVVTGNIVFHWWNIISIISYCYILHFIKISSIQTAPNYLLIGTLTSFLLIFPFSCICRIVKSGRLWWVGLCRL
jgi:hypothetical protein